MGDRHAVRLERLGVGPRRVRGPQRHRLGPGPSADPAEQKRFGCLEVAGEQEVVQNQNHGNAEETVTPTVETAPTQETVPTSVDAGLADVAVAPAGPRWLAPILGGVLMLGLAGSPG